MQQLSLGTQTLLSLSTVSNTLNQVPGLGSNTIDSWIHSCGMTPRTLTIHLTSLQWHKILRLYEQHTFPNMKNAIQQAILNSTYRGWRHSLNLPVRGQSTHRNAQTQRNLSPLSNISLDGPNTSTFSSHI